MIGVRKKKGLFGKMGATPGIGDGIEGMTGIEPVPMAQAGAASGSPQEEDKGGFFRKGGPGQYVLAGIADFIARRQGYEPTAATNIMAQAQREQQMRAQAAAAQQERAQDLADWRYKEDYKAENAQPQAPNLREDNAGNVWQFDPSTGMPMGDAPVWVDPTEKIIYQDGMQIRVPNPYRSGSQGSDLPVVSDQDSYDAVPAGGQYRDAQGNIRTKQGGPSQPATGGF